jgi:cell division protein FtsB
MNWRFQLPQRWLIYLLGSGLILLSLVTVVGERGVFHLWRLQGEKRKLDEQNYRLQKENEALRRRISALRYDDFYLEKYAREELNLVRPGEIIYRFRSSESKKTPSGSVNATPSGSHRSAAQKPPR